MTRFLDWLLITLAVIGAITVVVLIWAAISEWRGESDDEDFDFEKLLSGMDASPADAARGAAAQLENEYDWWNMDVGTLASLSEFSDAVELLADEDTPVDDVVALSRDGNGWVASMALAALAQRDDVPNEWVVWAMRHPGRPSNVEDAFLLDALATHAVEPVIGAVLPALGSIRGEAALEFVRTRFETGEVVSTATFERASLDDEDQINAIETFIDTYERELGPDFRKKFDSWRALQYLRGAGRVREKPYDDPPTLLVGRRRELVETVLTALGQSPPRSVLIVGEHGVGKTALARAALDRLDDDVIVFETTAAQLNAGAVYVGELEGRVKTLVDALRREPVVWHLPELQEALFAGQHSRSPQGLLDALLPHIEAGTIMVVAEVTPSAAELLVAARPRVTSAFEIVRVRPLDDAETIAVARHALEHDTLDVTTEDETLAESFELAQHFLPGVAAPGNLLRVAERDGRRGCRTGQDGVRQGGRAGDALVELRAAARAPRPGVTAATRGRARVLRRARARADRGGRLHRRAHRDDQGRSHGPDAAARRLPLRRPDRNRQDGDREGARGVPLRLIRPPRPARHERVPDARVPRAPPVRHRDGVARRHARLLDSQGAVRGGASRRVREGGAADLGHLPAGVRRRAAHRPAGTRRRLPTLRHRSHLEPRRLARGRRRARLRAARPAVLGRRGGARGRALVPS